MDDMTPGERWHGTLTWIDSTGGEHRWNSWHNDHTLVVAAMAGYFELVAMLAEALGEDLTPPEPGAVVVRHVWGTAVSYHQADGTEHTDRGWAVSGDEAWLNVVNGHARLVDLRELFRQVYGYHPPRPLGADAFTEALAAYDERPQPGRERLDAALKRLGVDPDE